jgi:hypothetical protein
VSLSADAVIRILEGRYDHYSARVVLKEAANAAGLDPAGPFEPAAAKKLATEVSRSGSRVDAVVAELRSAAAESGKKAPAKKAPAKKAEPAPAAEAAADESGGDEAAPADEGGGDGGGAKRSRRKKS